MISKDTLKGYLLEEILAYLIRNTGYQLLVDPSQDEQELERQGHGLVVKGRGAVHQADVLGQLSWIPAFTFPIRLFVEAKCLAKSVGLPHVRNAVGVLDDLNQNYSPVNEGRVRLQRFTYRYALFSTSGFSRYAVDMATAHQISLIDLSGPDFTDLRHLLDELVDLALQDSQLSTMRHFPKLMRFYMRRQLETWPRGISYPSEFDESYDNIQHRCQISGFESVLRTGVDSFGELFVGMANGPFLLVFKSDAPGRFLSYARGNPVHRVTITWSRREGPQGQWVIQPVDDSDAYSLSFGLPQPLADWILADEGRIRRRAWDVKQKFLSDITIYHHVDQRDNLYRLVYDATATRDSIRRVG